MVHNVTTIAFIECTLDTQWETLFGYPFESKPQMWSQHKALSNKSEVALVDIKNDRRYFMFKRELVIQLVNNVISFRSQEAEELAVDDSKKYLK
jgi:hypothetical protein